MPKKRGEGPLLPDKEMLKGYLESIMLSLLRREDLYGYELAKRIRDRSDGLFEMKEGTLYVVLKRLEQNDMIAPYWSDVSSGGGRRRYYKITVDGLRYLEEKKSQWLFFKRLMDVFFAESERNDSETERGRSRERGRSQ